jgi:hypothetical protein
VLKVEINSEKKPLAQSLYDGNVKHVGVAYLVNDKISQHVLPILNVLILALLTVHTCPATFQYVLKKSPDQISMVVHWPE